MINRIAACSCGQLNATVTEAPIRVSICHCTDCQRRTGSVFATQARFPRDAVEIAGSSTQYVRLDNEGRKKATFHFCPHSPFGECTFHSRQEMRKELRSQGSLRLSLQSLKRLLPRRPNTDAAISLPTLATSLTFTACTKPCKSPMQIELGFGDPDAMDRNGSRGEENGETKYEKVRTYSVPVRRGRWRRILRANLS